MYVQTIHHNIWGNMAVRTFTNIVPNKESIKPTLFIRAFVSLSLLLFSNTMFYRWEKGKFWESMSGLRGEVKLKALIWFLPAWFRCTGQ